MNSMTDKQKQCIEWICDTLGVTYYGSNTKQDAWKFINKFIDRTKEVSQESNFYNAWGLSYFFGVPLGRCRKR